MEHRSSEEDRHLLSKMVSECCDKHYEALRAMEVDDPDLITPLIMALLADQNLMVDQREDKNC